MPQDAPLNSKTRGAGQVLVSPEVRTCKAKPLVLNRVDKTSSVRSAWRLRLSPKSLRIPAASAEHLLAFTPKVAGDNPNSRNQEN